MSNNSNLQGTGTAELSDSDLDDWERSGSDNTEELLNDPVDEDIEVEAKSEDEADEDADESNDQEDENDDPEIDLGEGVAVKLSELKQGYQRTADYTRKTQALAAQQKQFEAMTATVNQQAEAINQRKTQLEETFDLTIDVLARQLPREPSVDLALTDPAGYMQQKAFYDAGMSEIQKVMQAKEASRSKIAEAENQNTQAQIAIEVKKLEAYFSSKKIEPAKREEFWKSTYEVGESIGISRVEMDTVTDSRLIIGLAELARYRAKEKALPTAKAGNAPINQAVRPQSSVAPRRVDVGKSSKSLKEFRETRSASAAERAWDAIDINQL